jgi:hypothetical protein
MMLTGQIKVVAKVANPLYFVSFRQKVTFCPEPGRREATVASFYTFTSTATV